MGRINPPGEGVSRIAEAAFASERIAVTGSQANIVPGGCREKVQLLFNIRLFDYTDHIEIIY